MVDFSLEGKIALVTGASRGIGERIACALAEKGARCILVGRKIETLEKVAQKIVNTGGAAKAIACNMGELAQINQLMAQVREEYGRLDILINNAAANPYFGAMINAEEWAWEKTNQVNLKGPFFMIQAAARLMTAGGGSIVNVASVNGVRPAPMQGIYSITKAGLIAMTKAYAKELAGYKIRVNALLPGMTETKFSSVITENKEIRQAVLAMIPLARIADPEEMTGAVLYLASDASSYTTGSCITCDGGMLA